MSLSTRWDKHRTSLRLSLRVRLMLGTLVWISIALLLAGFVLTNFFKNYATKQFELGLQTHLDQLTASFNVNDQKTATVSPPLSDPRFSQPLSGLYWQIDTTENTGLLRSRSLWDDVIRIPKNTLDPASIKKFVLTDSEIKTVRILERTITFEDQPDQRWSLIIAGNTSELEHVIKDWNVRLFLFLILLFITLCLAAIAQVILGLSPLRSLQTALQEMRMAPMRRLKGNFPQEVQPLIDDFNITLDQNEQVIARARAQTGDLAHSLKTPLAVIANAARKDLQHSGANTELATLVAEQVAVMQRHIDWRLKRARTAATQDSRHGSIEIAPVIEQLSRVMHRIYLENEISLSMQLEPKDISFQGETQDLQEILGNLMDNAYKWARSSVLIQASMQNNHLLVLISDDGPGLTPEQRLTVTQRGIRTDEKRPGSGLGLSITEELVHLYGGTMKLESSALGGLCVKLFFKSND